MAKNSSAAAVASAPATPAQMKADVASTPASGPSAAEPRTFTGFDNKPPRENMYVQEDSGPDFFESMIGASGRSFERFDSKPRNDNGTFAKKESKPEESTPAVESKAEKKSDPKPEPETDGDEVESDFDADTFNLILEKTLNDEEPAKTEAKEEKPAAKDNSVSDAASFTWAGIIGKQIPMGTPLGELSEFAPSEEAADALAIGDHTLHTKELNAYIKNTVAWAMDNAFHANAPRIQASAAAAQAATSAFESFFDKNPRYRGPEFQEAIGLAVQAVCKKKPGIGLRDALEAAKPMLDEASRKAARINKDEKGKAPAVVDQTGSNKGVGFKVGASRTRQVVNAQSGANPAPAAGKQFNYVGNPLDLLMP
jgi:hypothetical protein